MKQKDHKALGMYLLDSVGSGRLWKKTWHRRFFLLGCIGPDYVPFTYLRGFRQSHAMRGHNIPYSGKHIRNSIQKLEARGIHGLRDCFALGTLMHYLADSFTYPHTETFEGDIKAHRRYEKDLHGYFSNFLREISESPVIARVSEELNDFLRRGRKAYEEGEKSCEHDCRQILNACCCVFRTLCYGEVARGECVGN